MRGIIYALFIGLIMSANSFGAGPREAEWKAVETAISKGLPQTAITNLQAIARAATRERAWPEVVKATTMAISMEGRIQGSKAEEMITRLEAAMKTAPRETQPVLQTILGHWYWGYFQQNRWRFQQRTQTGEAPGKDFTTWDLPRIFAEIDGHFQVALQNEELLKKTSVQDWDALLRKGTMSDALRPTMYDFIAHQALEFYQAGEQAGARPQGGFELLADSPALDPAEAFLRWKPGTGGETNAAAIRAVELYQALLRFHLSDAEPRLAFADADLERITWAGNEAKGETKDERFKMALGTYIQAHADTDLTAIAYERLGRLLMRQNKLVEARAAGLKGAEIFPNSPGGALCRNMVKDIEQPGLSLTTERVWNCPGEDKTLCPEIRVNYRNLTRVHFRLVAADWEQSLMQRWDYGNRRKMHQALLAAKPTLAWEEELPPTRDYQSTNVWLKTPMDTLKPGYYLLIASSKPDMEEKGEPVFTTDVWVSKLALITRTRQRAIVDGLVLDAATGEPVAGAEVTMWAMDNNSRKWIAKKLESDKTGTFSHQFGEQTSFVVHAQQGADAVSSSEPRWIHPAQGDPITLRLRTTFFTDRALYRPGQTIQYKGILARVDTEMDTYEVAPDQEVTVILRDPNGKEIQRQKRKSNAYGSFSGSFTAPRGSVTGRMTIQDEARPEAAVGVSVEEYKRPKFEVTLPAPQSPPKLGGDVEMEGTAMAYTGAAIDGAAVTYRVLRTVRWPWWYWGWTPPAEEEIAHGTTRTDSQGNYRIQFVAKPDADADPKNEPSFVFRVHADVTDTAGETRSAEQSIRVGFAALEAFINQPDWLTEHEAVRLEIETKSLDGEPQVAEGSLRVYALEGPEQVQRPPLMEHRPDQKDMSDPRNWTRGALAGEQGFTTGTNGTAEAVFTLKAGMYRGELETQDRFGKKVTAQVTFQVLAPAAEKLAVKVPFQVKSPSWSLQPGEELLAVWGTGYDRGRALVEIERRGKVLQRYWTEPGRTQQAIKYPINEDLRGGFTLHVTQVRDNRAHQTTHFVQVPWENKVLEVQWNRFVSKLQPGQKETWSVTIRPKQPANAKEVVELVAALYDASLDAFVGHEWPTGFNHFYTENAWWEKYFSNEQQGLASLWGSWPHSREAASVRYRDFPDEIVGEGYMNRLGFGGGGGAYFARRGMVATAAAPAPLADMAMESRAASLDAAAPAATALFSTAGVAEKAKGEQDFGAPGAVDLSQVTARKNLAETAFFYPHLTADSNGVVTMSFTMPEALTKWRFLGFGHNRQLRSGLLKGEAVTAKDLMVQPNPPRFLREGDEIEFTVKVSNQSDQRQAGKVRLTFGNALESTNAAVDKQLGNTRPEQGFEIPAKESRTYAWRIRVPDGSGVLTYKAVAASATVSDGEEGPIPVLSRRILITESLPLPIRGPATKDFTFKKLSESGKSRTLQHQSYTIQMVSNPAWYAVLALPYLMEFPHECSEQVFNRIYANSLARHIAMSDPRIERVFEQWRNTPALDSPLEKNQDLKSVMIEETPWLRQAQAESQSRRNVGILFDQNRLTSETALAMQKLGEAQLENGAWPWFPGGPPNDYITLYITTGFGRLRHLGVDIDVQPALRALQRLDNWMLEHYQRIQKSEYPEAYVLSPTDALYLYGRSFFLKDKGLEGQHRQAVEFFLEQGRKFWLKTSSRQAQGHIALGLKRFAASQGRNDDTPKGILASLRERAVTNEEMGMFWRDTEFSWWWYHAPIETHALMIEAFDEVANDAKAVEELKVWLLKQKQTQDWKTTKATADAVYALLLKGQELLSSEALVQVSVAGRDITPGAGAKPGSKSAVVKPEAGTGFYEIRYSGPEVKPNLGRLRVKKTDKGVAWGSAHWQYLEDMSKVTPHTGTPLRLNKALFVKKNTAAGPTLEAVKGAIGVGDEVVVRVEIRVDRDMEYVHLKDQRGSGTEPVNVLSRYKYQDGLAYYESTRDTASHFFIDYLPKGVYVFEYSTRVQLRGEYQTGVAEIQCMYAPEFNSHSQSIPLSVK